MEIATRLGQEALAVAAKAVGRSLRLRGFVRREDGFVHRAGDLEQRVRIEPVIVRDPTRAGLQVRLRLAPTGVTELPFGSRVELPLWDLIPGRERGGCWTVTRETLLSAVASDIVAQLERHGLSWLDRLAAEPAAPQHPTRSAEGFLAGQSSVSGHLMLRSRWLASARSPLATLGVRRP